MANWYIGMTEDAIRQKVVDTALSMLGIKEATGSSQSAVSHQLRLLKQARLVRSRRNGKQVCYTLADDHVKTILGMAKEHLEE